MGVTLLENKFHLTSLSEYAFSEVNSMYTVLGTWVAAEQERKEGCPRHGPRSWAQASLGSEGPQRLPECWEGLGDMSPLVWRRGDFFTESMVRKGV